jgi:gamma-glutamylaminecyclotransferase
MGALVFVYGTLKQGFPNWHRNPGRRMGGLFRTRQRLPLYVASLPEEDAAPWLLDRPGQGHHVLGELYDVPHEALPELDAFEEVGQPLGYVRRMIEVESAEGTGTTVQAWAYLKPPAQLPACLTLAGPFQAYTPSLAAGYVLRAAVACP